MDLTEEISPDASPTKMRFVQITRNHSVIASVHLCQQCEDKQRERIKKAIFGHD